MKRRSQNHLSFLRLFAGWCGLLWYVGAFSPIGMGVVALLGTIDPDHHAMIQPGPDGLRLVLHHEGNCSGHHHGPVARTLTMLAQPASATDPDHVVQFSSANGFTRDSQLLVPAANQSDPSVVHFVEPFAFVASPSLQFIPPPRPPPGDDGTVSRLRSTVLLL